MSGRRAKAARRESKSRRLQRETSAQAWEWKRDGFEGCLAGLQERYRWIDGTSYRYWPTKVERYVFLVKREDELVGSAIVEVHPPSMLGRARSATKAAGIDIPLIGPCLHAQGEDVAMVAGVFVEPKQPLAVIFGLVDGIRQLHLPTYGHPVNRRTEPLLRHYLVA